MAKAKPVEHRSHAANYQRRHLALGLCKICPEPKAINPRTGMPYAYCPEHLASHNLLQKQLMRDRRAAARRLRGK